MHAQIFNKSYLKWKLKADRDLIYKLSLENVSKIPEIKQGFVTQKNIKTNDIFSNISLNILLFDEYPAILRIKNTIDNKKKNTILGTHIKLSVIKLYFFFLRLKNEEGLNSIKTKIKFSSKESNSININFNLNLFDEFLFLYDKYPTLNDVSLKLNFVNCKKMEEKQLLLKNFLLI